MLSPLQVFVIAVLLSFGTSLFSCTTPQGQTVGKIQITDAEIAKQNVPDNKVYSTAGIISCTIPEPTIQYTKGDTIINERLTGKIAIKPDTIRKNLPVVEIEASEVPLVSAFTTGALIAIAETNTGSAIDTDITGTSENNKEEMQASTDDFKSLIYPNPTNGLLNVDISARKDEFVQADLYDLSGRYISNLFIKQIVKPCSILQLNISEQTPGIYLLKIIIENKTRTERVVLEK